MEKIMLSKIEFNSIQGDKLTDVNIIELGIAKGHNVYIDEMTLSSLLNSKKKDKVVSKMGHYSVNDGLFDTVGYFTNFREKGNKVIADFTFVETELNKDKIDHIKKFIEVDPKLFGLSIDFSVDSIEVKDNKRYVRVDQLYSVDWVLHPAATNSVFAQTEVGEILQKNKSEFMNFYKKYKSEIEAEGFLFGEATLPDGTVISWVGDLAEGTEIYIAETGELAPDADHVVGEKIITTVNGVVTKIVEKEMEEELTETELSETTETEITEAELSEAELKEINELKSKFRRDAEQRIKDNLEKSKIKEQEKSKALELEIEELKAKLSKSESFTNKDKPMKQAPNLTKTKSEFSMEMFKDAYKHYNENKKKFDGWHAQAKAGSTQFSTGADFTDALGRCAYWVPQIMYEIIRNDSLLSRFTLQTFVSPGNFVNAPLQIVMPNNTFNPTNLWEVRDPNACTEFTPTGTASPNQRVINTYYLEYNYELCPIEWKSIYNGLTWEGYDQYPADTAILIMITQRLVRDLELIMLNGRTGPGGTITGLLGEIANGILSGDIPAANVLTPYGTYSSATAIADVEALIDLIPFNMQLNTNNQLFIAQNAVSNYFRNYRNAYGFGYALNNQMPSNNQAYFGVPVPDAQFPVEFSPINLLQLANIPTAFITDPSNIRYVLENPSTVTAPEVWYRPEDRKVKFRWQTYFGINYATGWNMVVNQ